MRLKIFLTAFFFLITVHVEAAETFGVPDIISRVIVTNLKGDVVKTFPNARHEILAELVELLAIPGKIELIDFGTEFAIEAMNEQTIMQQLGVNQVTQTNYSACNYIIFMYLTNCNEVIEDKIVKKSNAVKVDLSVRIIEKTSGKCVFVGTGSGVAKAKDYRALGLLKFKTFECPEEQFYEAIKAATHQIALKIKERI